MKLWEFHPALVHFPLALLIGGMALDMYAACRKREALARFAAGMLVWGVAAGWIAGAAGVVAWYTAPSTDETTPLMVWHPLVAAASLVVFTVLAVIRWRGRGSLIAPAGEIIGAAAALLLLGGASLGGHLVYHDAIGVVGPESSHADQGPSKTERSKPPLTAD